MKRAFPKRRSGRCNWDVGRDDGAAKSSIRRPVTSTTEPVRSADSSLGIVARVQGKAIVFEYPKCKDNRVVADVVRLDKGHTEGLEPNVTEALVKLIVAAPGGKIQKMN
jgi:hypothetical protein